MLVLFNWSATIVKHPFQIDQEFGRKKLCYCSLLTNSSENLTVLIGQPPWWTLEVYRKQLIKYIILLTVWRVFPGFIQYFIDLKIRFYKLPMRIELCLSTGRDRTHPVPSYQASLLLCCCEYIYVARSTSRLRKQPGMGDKCFRCGATEHKTVNCPQDEKIFKNGQASIKIDLTSAIKRLEFGLRFRVVFCLIDSLRSFLMWKF